MKKLLVILVMLIAINANAQWEKVDNGLNGNWFQCSAVNENTIFVGNGDGAHGLYRSTNNGLNWSQIAFNSSNIEALAANGNNIFASLAFGHLNRSTNNGDNWEFIFYDTVSINCIAVNGNNVFLGTPGKGVYLSTNIGANWTRTSLNNESITSIVISGNRIFAGGTFGVYISTNNGTNWTQTVSPGIVASIAVSGNNVFAGSSGYIQGVSLSTDNGITWSQAGLNTFKVVSLAISGNSIFAGTWYNGVFLSTNNGATWINKYQGFLYLPTVSSLAIINNYIFACTWTLSVWRRSLSEIMGIQNISTETPSKYSLSQNYPNPFNSMCNVQFSMCNAGYVKLVVYDIQGREVQTLVNERLQPGTYEAAFDGSALNSGVYFYKLITGTFTETKKMILIK